MGSVYENTERMLAQICRIFPIFRRNITLLSDKPLELTMGIGLQCVTKNEQSYVNWFIG